MKFPSLLFGRPALPLAALTLPLLSGCRLFFPLMNAPQPAVPQPAVPQAQNAAAPWQTSARAAKTRFAPGEPVELQISVRNTTEAPKTLRFSSGQRFDFQATRVGETETSWTWSADKSFVLALSEQTVGPGQTQSWKAQWPAPTPGTYRVTGTVTSENALKAKPFEIVVE